MAAGSITVDYVVTGTLSVTITATSGKAITLYADSACTTSVSMPDSITASKTYYVSSPDFYNISVKRDGQEIASDADTAIQGVRLETGRAMRFAPVPNVTQPGLRIGQNPGASGYGVDHSDSSASPIDFWWDDIHRRLHTRTILLTENGDPAEVAIRRSGDAGWDATPAALTDGYNIGLVHWTGWSDNGGAGGFDTRQAQIYVRAKGNLTNSNHGGELFIGTNSQNTAGNPPDTVGVRADGNVDIMRGGLGIKSSGSAPSAATTGYGQLYVQNGALYFKGTSGTVTKIADA